MPHSEAPVQSSPHILPPTSFLGFLKRSKHIDLQGTDPRTYEGREKIRHAIEHLRTTPEGRTLKASTVVDALMRVGVNIPWATRGWLYMNEVHTAVENGNIDDVISLLKEQPDCFENILFVDAATYGNKQMLLALIKLANELNMTLPPETGLEALVIAIKNNHKEVIDLLLEQPTLQLSGEVVSAAILAGNIDLYRRFRAMNVEIPKRALHDCIDAGQHEIMWDIIKIKGINPNYGFEKPIAAAARKGDIKAVCMLMNLVNIDSWPGLCIAVENGNAKLVKLLLQAPRIDVNSFHGLWGKTLLTIACEKGCLEIAKMLLDHRDIDVNLGDYPFGKTPLIFACEKGHLEIAKMLVYHPQIEVNGEIFSDQNPPVFYAIDHRHPKIAYLLVSSPDLNPNVRAIAGDHSSGNPSLLQFASERSQPMFDVIDKLLQRDDLDPNLADAYGVTALNGASKKGNNKVVQLILSYPNIDPNKADNKKQTPLHGAAEQGHIAIVKMLLAHRKIDPSLTRWDGKTAEDIARARGHHEIAEMLRKALL